MYIGIAILRRCPSGFFASEGREIFALLDVGLGRTSLANVRHRSVGQSFNGRRRSPFARVGLHHLVCIGELGIDGVGVDG